MEQKFVFDSRIERLRVIKPDFKLIIEHSGKKHEIMSYLAILHGLSRKLQFLVICDPFVRSLSISMVLENTSISQIEEFFRTGEAKFTVDNVNFWFQFAQGLDCEFLYDCIKKYVNLTKLYERKINNRIDNIPYEALVPNIQFLIKNKSFWTQSFDFDDKLLSIVPHEKIKDHIELFYLIKSLGSNYIRLFSYVDFDKLSKTEIKDFFLLIKGNVNGSIWFNLSSIIMDSQIQPGKLQKTFKYSHDDKFNGVFCYLFSKYRQVENVLLSLNSGGERQRTLINLFNYDDPNRWWDNSRTKNELYRQEDQFFEIILMRHTLVLTNYSMRHSLNGQYKGQPKHWRVYGLNENSKWVLIHEVSNAVSMNEPNGSISCEILPIPQPYSGFRFEQIDNFILGTTKNQLRFKFVLEAIELFGVLTEK